jgi:hypothetical protein
MWSITKWLAGQRRDRLRRVRAAAELLRGFVAEATTAALINGHHTDLVEPAQMLRQLRDLEDIARRALNPGEEDPS